MTPEAFLSFLSLAPSVFTLSETTILSHNNSDKNDNDKKSNHGNSRIQFFKMQRSKTSPEAIGFLLDGAVNQIPRLARLELDVDIILPTQVNSKDSVNITPGLVVLFNQGCLLRHLVITEQNLTVDLVDIIKQALVTKLSLQHYHVPLSTNNGASRLLLLREYHSTLEHVMDYEPQ